MKGIPVEIKRAFITSVILILTVLTAGLIFRRAELYLAFTLGGLFALINACLLTKEVYTMVYIRENVKGRNALGYFIRLGVLIGGMLLVVFLTRKYHPNKVSVNIVFAGLGFMIFKISIIINQKIKKFAKRK